MAIVTILGAGRMGTAVTWPLVDNGHEVRLVGTHLDAEIIRSCQDARFHPGLRRRIPDGVQPFYLEELAGALTGADVIVSGVNSLGVHWIEREAGAAAVVGRDRAVADQRGWRRGMTAC